MSQVEKEEAEEDIIRNRLDQLEIEAAKLSERNQKLKKDCNKDMIKLLDLRKEERFLKEEFEEIYNQTTAIKKQQKKRQDHIRSVTSQIGKLEQKHAAAVILHKQRQVMKPGLDDPTGSQLLGDKHSGHSLLREKHRLKHESNMQEIQSEKKHLYLEYRKNKAEMAKKRIEMEQKTIDGNRKRHLEVMYQERLLQIARETSKHTKIQENYNRIMREREERAQSKEMMERRIEKIKKIKEEERIVLEQQKEREDKIRKKFRMMLCPYEYDPYSLSRRSSVAANRRSVSKMSQSMDKPRQFQTLDTKDNFLLTSVETQPKSTYHLKNADSTGITKTHRDYANRSNDDTLSSKLLVELSKKYQTTE